MSVFHLIKDFSEKGTSCNGTDILKFFKSFISTISTVAFIFVIFFLYNWKRKYFDSECMALQKRDFVGLIISVQKKKALSEPKFYSQTCISIAWVINHLYSEINESAYIFCWTYSKGHISLSITKIFLVYFLLWMLSISF